MKRAVRSLGGSIAFVASAWIVSFSNVSAADITAPIATTTLQVNLESGADTVVSATGSQPMPAWTGVTDQQLASARHRAAQAAQQLDQFLMRGTAENRAAWQSFLGWQPMQQQLQSNEPDPTALGEVLTKLISGEPGLELPPFVDLRNTLMTLRRMVMAKSDPSIEQRFNEQVSALHNSMHQADTLSEPQLIELANQLEWFEQLEQAPQLVAQARHRFGHANLWVSASAYTISRGFSEPVSETTSLNEMILGTHLCGTAHTQGTLSAQLVPSNHAATIDLCLNGITHSDTVGYQSPVTIRSHGITRVIARTRLTIDPLGVRAEPATASCTTNSHINSISAGGKLGSRLIERVAWKKAGQQKGQAEQISSRRAEQRIAQRMNDQTMQRIGTTNYRWESELREPMRKKGNYPRALSIWSSAERLHMTAVQAQPSQLAAPSSPPATPAENLSVQVHQSLVANTAVNTIGGMTITDERAQELVKEMTGEVPEELKIKQDEDPWSITFDLQQPIGVTFDDNVVRIALRARKFVRGDQVVREKTQIAANYRLEIADGRVNLVRQGDIDVSYPDKDGDRLSLTELRNKTFLTNKFEGLFKPELNGEGLKLPNQWANLKDLALNYAATDNGWLSLGWK